jgi:hypothetical protein
VVTLTKRHRLAKSTDKDVISKALPFMRSTIIAARSMYNAAHVAHAAKHCSWIYNGDIALLDAQWEYLQKQYRVK